MRSNTCSSRSKSIQPQPQPGCRALAASPAKSKSRRLYMCSTPILGGTQVTHSCTCAEHPDAPKPPWQCVKIQPVCQQPRCVCAVTTTYPPTCLRPTTGPAKGYSLPPTKAPTVMQNLSRLAFLPLSSLAASSHSQLPPHMPTWLPSTPSPPHPPTCTPASLHHRTSNKTKLTTQVPSSTAQLMRLWLPTG
jgi:hypothetical protein